MQLSGRLAPSDEGQEQECGEEQEGEGEWSVQLDQTNLSKYIANLMGIVLKCYV